MGYCYYSNTFCLFEVASITVTPWPCGLSLHLAFTQQEKWCADSTTLTINQIPFGYAFQHFPISSEACFTVTGERKPGCAPAWQNYLLAGNLLCVLQEVWADWQNSPFGLKNLCLYDNSNAAAWFRNLRCNTEACLVSSTLLVTTSLVWEKWTSPEKPEKTKLGESGRFI